MFFKHIPILVYHQIVSNDEITNRSEYAMPVDQFQQQMQYLYDLGYHCLTLQEFLELPADKPHQHDRTFVLTFDDGYEDFLTNAYPILCRYGYTATVFLTTNHIGERSCWEGATGAPLLNWEQITFLYKAGISFESHSCTHPRLLSLTNEQIWHELTASKEHLEARLGGRVQFLAYPYGESTSEIRDIAREAGYEAACGVITGQRGLFNLWRYPCNAYEPLFAFAFKLTYMHDCLIRWRKWLREDTVLGPYLRRAKFH